MHGGAFRYGGPLQKYYMQKPDINRIAKEMEPEVPTEKDQPDKGHKDAVKSDKDSQLSAGIALDVVGIIRDELAGLGCRLKDYYIDFTANGFDISNIDIYVKDPQRIIDAIKEAEPEVRHEFSKKQNRYAYMAANVEVARRVSDELGLDYRAFVGEKTGRILVSVSEPKEEKPLPPSQEMPMLPPEIAASVEEPLSHDEGLGGGDDMGLGGGGGLGGGLGGIGGGPEGLGLGPSEPLGDEANPEGGEGEIEEMPIEGEAEAAEGEEGLGPEEGLELPEEEDLTKPEKPARPGMEF